MNRLNVEDPKLLLPWYVNGTLSAAEQAEVENHLNDCADCRDAVDQLRRIAAAVESEQPTPLVPEAPVKDFMENLPPQERGLPRRYRLYAAAATILVLVGSAYLIATQPPETHVFQTVMDAPETAGVSYVFDIEIDADAATQVQRAVEARIAEGDILKTESGYRVVVSMPSATMTELDDYADSLRQIDGIQRVDVVGVQLPID